MYGHSSSSLIVCTSIESCMPPAAPAPREKPATPSFATRHSCPAAGATGFAKASWAVNWGEGRAGEDAVTDVSGVGRRATCDAAGCGEMAPNKGMCRETRHLGLP